GKNFMKLLRKSGFRHFFDSLRAPVHTPHLPLIEFYGIHERGRERNAQDRAGTHGEVEIQCAAGPGGRPAGGGRLAVRGAEGMSGAVRCAIYTRLSKEDGDRQGDASESIRNQKALLTAYAAD